jgi:hypothetical protein
MVPRKALRRSLVAASAVLIAACQDAPSPVAPPEVTPSLSRAAAAQQAASAFDRASAEVLALPATVFADYDEVKGRLVFGVENAAAIRGVQTALGRLGLASSTYDVQVTKPIFLAATLRDAFRPTQGGIQIHFGQFVCTLGFNVDHTGGRSFITNSHCTNTQGGTEGTVYYQPTSTLAPTSIATEVADPTYFRNTGGCPRGKKCRYSDASRALYNSGTASSRGVIAKTTGANNGSLTVGGTFTVTSQDNSTTSFPTGTAVNKIGRTTGWTSAGVTNSCVNVNVSGSNITQLCQTIVTSPTTVLVGGGDSGSPVFRVTSVDNVQLVGILWGGSSDGRTFVFSPLQGVQRELGSVTATQ